MRTRRHAIGVAYATAVPSKFNALSDASSGTRSAIADASKQRIVALTPPIPAGPLKRGEQSMYKSTTTRLRVQAAGGEMRELDVFCEARLCDTPAAQVEALRWARDAEGRWYSFSTMDPRSLVESSSGDWFSILA